MGYPIRMEHLKMALAILREHGNSDLISDASRLLSDFTQDKVTLYMKPTDMPKGIGTKVVYFTESAPSQYFDDMQKAVAHKKYQDACAIVEYVAGSSLQPSECEEIVQKLHAYWNVAP